MFSTKSFDTPLKATFKCFLVWRWCHYSYALRFSRRQIQTAPAGFSPPPFWARSVLVSAEPGFQSNSREKGGSVRPLKPIKLRRLGFWRGGGRNGGGVRFLKTQFIWILNVNALENQKLFVDVKAGFVLQIRESATIDANCSKKTTHSTLQKKKEDRQKVFQLEAHGNEAQGQTELFTRKYQESSLREIKAKG